jgi:hypothetical protein
MARRTHIEAAMNNTLTKSTLFAIILAGGIYFLTPPLAMSFYELYHLVKILQFQGIIYILLIYQNWKAKNMWKK